MKILSAKLQLSFGLVFGLFLLGSCSTTTGMYGLNATGANIVFLLDVSGSMAGQEEKLLWKREAKGIADRVARGAIQQQLSPTISSLGSTIYSALNDGVTNRLTKLGGAKERAAHDD